jgi:hypothetical protein
VAADSDLDAVIKIGDGLIASVGGKIPFDPGIINDTE